MLTSYNEKFVEAFKKTPAFELWDQSTDAVIFDLVEPKYVYLLASFKNYLLIVFSFLGIQWKVKLQE